MGSLLHLGFDVSTTGAGAVLIDRQGQIIKAWSLQTVAALDGPSHVDKRIFLMGDWADSVFGDGTVLDRYRRNYFISYAIESPFFRGSSSSSLAEVQGAVKSRRDTPWSPYSPSTVKATASRVTGLTIGTKDDAKENMGRAFIERWGRPNFAKHLITAAQHAHDHDKAIGDLVDAAWVAETDRLTVQERQKRSTT